VSILLTTLFKASVTASVGLCFAQHLWLLLRGRPTPIALVDKLFTLRTNIFALVDPRSMWRAPVLFSMALFVWCLGIAMIYPPGALTVALEAWPSEKNMRLSVMNPPMLKDFNPMVEASLSVPSLALYQAAIPVHGEQPNAWTMAGSNYL